MSDKEGERLKILEQMGVGVLTTEQGGQRLGVTRRQAQRLLGAYRRHGDVAARHGLRERRPNNAKPPDLRACALELVRTHYSDFGPTLASEELAERRRPVARSTQGAPPSAAPATAALLWRADPDRHQRARLAGGAWGGIVAGGVDR